MDIYEDDVRWPTRALQQEEEQQAASTAAACLEPATVQWVTEGSGVTTQLLVVADSQASCELLRQCFPDAQVVAHAVLPAITPPEDLPAAAAVSRVFDASSCPLLAPAACPGLLLALLAAPLHEARAGAWVRGVMRSVQPDRVLALTSMQAERYSGEGDPSQEGLAFLLRTGAAAAALGAKGPAAGVPLLPTGHALGGVPAALLTQCELRGLPAALVVSVDMLAAMAGGLALPAVAKAAAGVAAAFGQAAAAQKLRVPTAVAATQQRLDALPSALSALYA